MRTEQLIGQLQIMAGGVQVLAKPLTGPATLVPKSVGIEKWKHHVDRT